MSARDQVVEIIRSGERITISEIAARCGVSRQRIHRILRQEGLRAPVDGRLHPRRPSSPDSSQMAPPVVTGGIPESVSKTAGGQISELLAAADLLARGYRPFRPVVGNSLFDIVAINPRTGAILTIEVKSGRKIDGRLVFQRNSCVKVRHCESEPDHYAVVCKGEPVEYVPPLPSDV